MKNRKLAKVGRKREDAIREANGRVSRSQNLSAKPPAEVRRLRDAAVAGMRDEVWGTEIGRLYLAGRIDAHEFDAGKVWRAIVHEWREANGLPAPSPRSLSNLEGGSRSHEPDEASPDGQKRATRARRATEAMVAAHDALSAAGAFAKATVREACELDRAIIGLHELSWLRDGLDALAAHLRDQGLTPSRANVRNRA